MKSTLFYIIFVCLTTISFGQSLQFIEEISGNLPDTNTQGIVAI